MKRLRAPQDGELLTALKDRKSTRLNSSHSQISYAVFCLKKKTKTLEKVTTPTCRSARLSSDHRSPTSRATSSHRGPHPLNFGLIDSLRSRRFTTQRQ